MLDPNLKQPFTYAGREYDEETELYYYRARYYDADTGRFISEDPIGFEGGDVNLFRYVGNNPVNFVDPWGLHGFMLWGRQPFIFRYPGVNRLAPKQRYIPPRSIPRNTPARQCEPVSQPLPEPPMENPWWQELLKNIGDLLDGLGGQSTTTDPTSFTSEI